MSVRKSTFYLHTTYPSMGKFTLYATNYTDWCFINNDELDHIISMKNGDFEGVIMCLLYALKVSKR